MSKNTLGNPLAVAAVAEKALESKAVANAAKTTGKVILIGAGAATLYFGGQYVIRKINEILASNGYGDNPDIQAAVAIRNACNPIGFSFMINADGTNESKLYEVARGIDNWKGVSKEYKKLYGETLLERLEKEMNANELAKFTAFVNMDKSLLLEDGSDTSSVPVSAYSASDTTRITGSWIPMKDYTIFDHGYILTLGNTPIRRWSNEYMDELWDAIKTEAAKPWYEDSDEDKIFNMFKTAPSKAAISLFAYRVFVKHGTWYLPTLYKFIGGREWNTFYNIIKDKPLYV